MSSVVGDMQSHITLTYFYSGADRLWPWLEVVTIRFTKMAARFYFHCK